MTKETTQRYVVHLCSACGLAFTTPRPTPEELDAFYTESYFATATEGLGYGDYRGDSWAESNARAMWQSLHAWAEIDVPEKSVLDIGCATGAFLAEAKADGWRVHGVEKAASAAAIAEREFGVPVSSEVADVPGAFGLVTMWHVLEHLLDPLTALAEARTKVMDGASCSSSCRNGVRSAVGRTAAGGASSGRRNTSTSSPKARFGWHWRQRVGRSCAKRRSNRTSRTRRSSTSVTGAP